MFNQAIDPDTENISEDELPTMQAAKVPETEEVSDEELPGPKLAELPADTEVNIYYFVKCTLDDLTPLSKHMV